MSQSSLDPAICRPHCACPKIRGDQEKGDLLLSGAMKAECPLFLSFFGRLAGGAVFRLVSAKVPRYNAAERIFNCRGTLHGLPAARTQPRQPL
jgi:hypothetical protein